MTKIRAIARRTIERYSERGILNYVWIVFSTVTLMLLLSISACNSMRLNNETVDQVPTQEAVPSKWYAVEVPDTEPNLLLDQADITIDEDKSYSLYFYFPPPLDGQWPVGSYKVEIYFNNVLNTTVPFTVQ